MLLRSNLSRNLTIAAFLVCGLGFAWAGVAEDRILAFGVFLVGFVLGVGGVILSIFRASETIESRWMRLGMKIGAGGFVIFMLGIIYGSVAESGTTTIVSNIGFAIAVAGILLSIGGVVKKS
jgi:hypothetical protein